MENKKISEQQIKHLAKLTGLSLTSDEIKKFPKQFSEILDYFEILKQVNTKEIKATSQVTGLENVFDPDKPTASLPIEAALKNAKSKYDNFFKVKAVLKK